MKLFDRLQPSVSASYDRALNRMQRKDDAEQLLAKMKGRYKTLLDFKGNLFPRPAPPTLAGCLAPTKYRYGMTRRELRTLRTRTGFTTPFPPSERKKGLRQGAPAWATT